MNYTIYIIIQLYILYNGIILYILYNEIIDLSKINNFTQIHAASEIE